MSFRLSYARVCVRIRQVHSAGTQCRQLVDAVVLHLTIYNGEDDCDDGIDSAETLIQPSRLECCSSQEVQDFVTEVVGVLEQEGVPGVAVEDHFGVRQPLGHRVAGERVDHDVVGAVGDEHGQRQLA